jgi:hypothetical protein
MVRQGISRYLSSPSSTSEALKESLEAFMFQVIQKTSGFFGINYISYKYYVAECIIDWSDKWYRI